MRLAALSNEKLSPWINWTTLGPPLLKPLATKPGATYLAPPPLRLRNTGEWAKAASQLYDSDTLFWMQGSARPETSIWAAAALRGRVKRSAFVVDAWPRCQRRIGALAVMQKMDPCFVAFRQARDQLSKAFPRGRFEWMPFGIDADVFRPRDLEKDVFIYWMGRRYEPLHQAILAYCHARNLKYVYTTPDGHICDPAELGKLVSRARYFVVTPPCLDGSRPTDGISPLVMRYMEGLAAGTRLLGVLPASGEYEDLLPLDAILQVKADGSDLAQRLAVDAEDPGADKAVARASELVRSQHSWQRRADQIFARLKDGQVAFPT